MRFFQNQFSRRCNFPFDWVRVLGNITVQNKESYEFALLFETEHIFQKANNPDFIAALELSSEVLIAQLKKIENPAAFLKNKKNRQTLRGILRYMTRACTRTTPFGRFASLVCSDENQAAIDFYSLSPFILQYLIPFQNNTDFLKSELGIYFKNKTKELDAILKDSKLLYKEKNRTVTIILKEIFESLEIPIDLDAHHLLYLNQWKIEPQKLLQPQNLDVLASLYFSLQKDIDSILEGINDKKINEIDYQALNIEYEASKIKNEWNITSENGITIEPPSELIDLQNRYFNCIVMYDKTVDKYIVNHIILSPYKVIQLYKEVIPMPILSNYNTFLGSKTRFITELDSDEVISKHVTYADRDVFVNNNENFETELLKKILINEADWNGKLEQIAENTILEIIPKTLLYSPEISHQNFILKRDQWYIKSDCIKEMLKYKNDFEAFSILKSFIEKHKIPLCNMVYIEDHPQYIHFNAPILVQLFTRELEKAGKWIKIEPLYPIPDEYATEYVVECMF
jgi:hypothetical protein